MPRFFFREKGFECPEGVYFPSEDSYFLAENVRVKKGDSVIDMGCGSGIQSLNALFQGASSVTAADVNKKAIDATLKNCESAGFAGKIRGIGSFLFENIDEKADIIIFNPPYVPSEDVKYVDLDGGKKGRETLDLFLGEFPKHLNTEGRCFFLQTDINGYAETESILRRQKTDFKKIASRRGFFEELTVYECVKRP